MNTAIYVVTMESDDMDAIDIGYATSRKIAKKFLSQGYFQYGEHYFKPNGKIDPVRGATLANINLRSHTELRMWDKYFATALCEEPAMWYEHDGFYTAMNDCDDDIFLCDNGKQYIPCNHELMEFIGYR